MDEILWCDHSDETSSAVLSHGTIYSVCSSNFHVYQYGVTIENGNFSAALSHGTIHLVRSSDFGVRGRHPVL